MSDDVAVAALTGTFVVISIVVTTLLILWRTRYPIDRACPFVTCLNSMFMVIIAGNKNNEHNSFGWMLQSVAIFLSSKHNLSFVCRLLGCWRCSWLVCGILATHASPIYGSMIVYIMLLVFLSYFIELDYSCILAKT